MSEPIITVGERRGLIALIILLCIVTAVLYVRTRSYEEPVGKTEQRNTEVQTSVADSLHVVGGGSEGVGNRAQGGRSRKTRRSQIKGKSESTAPVRRSPRDERIDDM